MEACTHLGTIVTGPCIYVHDMEWNHINAQMEWGHASMYKEWDHINVHMEWGHASMNKKWGHHTPINMRIVSGIIWNNPQIIGVNQCVVRVYTHNRSETVSLFFQGPNIGYTTLVGMRWNGPAEMFTINTYWEKNPTNTSMHCTEPGSQPNDPSYQL